jgi:hypothetical protein
MMPFVIFPSHFMIDTYFEREGKKASRTLSEAASLVDGKSPMDGHEWERCDDT